MHYCFYGCEAAGIVAVIKFYLEVLMLSDSAGVTDELVITFLFITFYLEGIVLQFYRILMFFVSFFLRGTLLEDPYKTDCST